MSQDSQLEKLLSRLCRDDLALRQETFIAGPKVEGDDLERGYWTFWIDRVNAKSEMGIADVVSSCSAVMRSPQERHNRACLVFHDQSDSWYNGEDLQHHFVLVMEHHSRKQLETSKRSHPHSVSISTSAYGWNQSRRLANARAILFVLLLATVSVILLVPFLPTGKQPAPAGRVWPEDGYIHYPTPNSIGPKRQIQLGYENAMDWIRSNPHDDGQWRVRMDDQALIPAELWDEDEDYYQSWYYERYPHLRKIIQERLYLRPSWLGSIGKVVEWDREFHFNHCVVAFRRYWKAKESGRHVCPRDVDHNHIQHCLNWLEGKVFGPGGLNASMSPPVEDMMMWQTKVCY